MIPQPQKVARLWFPKFTEHTTPIHQDFVHFQGCHENLDVLESRWRLPARTGRTGRPARFS